MKKEEPHLSNKSPGYHKNKKERIIISQLHFPSSLHHRTPKMLSCKKKKRPFNASRFCSKKNTPQQLSILILIRQLLGGERFN